MPEISRFYGISIHIRYREHGPAHFHARYGDYAISVTMDTGVIQGTFPKRALRLVLDWHDLHREELLNDWDRATHGAQLLPIPPLE
jgi:hypothetical protein